jgi:hypothetical protein
VISKVPFIGRQFLMHHIVKGSRTATKERKKKGRKKERKKEKRKHEGSKDSTQKKIKNASPYCL